MTTETKIKNLELLIETLQSREIYRMGALEIREHYRDLTNTQNELIELLRNN